MDTNQRKKNIQQTGAWFIRVATDKDLKRPPRLKIVKLRGAK